MATQQEERGSKRKLIDADTQEEILDTKKNRVDINTTLKSKVLSTLCQAAHTMFHTLKIDGSSLGNINLNIQISNVVFTCHNILRQRASGLTTGNMDKKTENKEFTFTYAGKRHPMAKATALKIMEESAARFGLRYEKYDIKDTENWYGVAGPYSDFFAGLGYRLTELRLGHAEMTISKDKEGVEKRFPVRNYGICPNHHILLEGVGFPPEKRASMAQSLGPLTMLLCFLRSKEDYRNKWKSACKRSMSHLPYIDDLLNVLQNKSANDCSTVVSVLADTLLMIGSRKANRIFFPILPFGQALTKTGGIMDDGFLDFDEANLTKVNCSGHGAFAAYKIMRQKIPKWSIFGEYTPSQARQIVYHCMFGTFCEDLELLKVITNEGNWYTRSEMGKCFQGMGSSSKMTEFEPIDQIFYSKLASANLCKEFASNYTQLSFQPVFSGGRVQHFSKEFMDSLGKGMGTTAGLRTLADLQKSVRNYMEYILKTIKKNGGAIRYGTVDWRETRTLTWNEPGAVQGITEPQVHKYFLGNPSKED